MAMRSWVSRGSVTRVMDSTNRGAFSRFFSDKGRVLSEEEQAKENVYIQKWERERLEKQKLQAGKVRAEKDKNAAEKNEDTADKVHAFLFGLLILLPLFLLSNLIYSLYVNKLRFWATVVSIWTFFFSRICYFSYFML
ncbi:hypothetical protein V8G54_029188 [Vigna mungo]|uniref:Uncharacterized protein n=1 Tax=Vigna mungo TaxID=3915 RepID=A0AAQ3MTF1_VIGMU